MGTRTLPFRKRLCPVSRQHQVIMTWCLKMARRELMQAAGNLLLYSGKYTCLLRLAEHKLHNPLQRRFFCIHVQLIEKQPKENCNLVNRLENMGVDVCMARKRQPGVLKKMITHEKGLTDFLQDKGANKNLVASVISRYPRSITRTHEHLEKKWEIWHGILKSDSEVLKVLERSPESFFRSSNIANLEKNVEFLSSVGLTSKQLARLMVKAPRTFANRMELNQQMVDYLNDLHVGLGGENTTEFVKQIITKNMFLLSQSITRVKANIEFLQTALKLSNRELLLLLQGYGADLLDLCHDYVKLNFRNIKFQLLALGCTDEQVIHFVFRYPPLLYLSPNTFSDKIDCILKSGIHIQQILDKPRVLDVGINTLTTRISRLQDIGYNFQKDGIGLLEFSKTRFEAKFKKLL
ncbi:transcription termination factor 1, mitochondrial [Ambystoma mexicanum]|uniref:transcription termination factor 1, mitochondrial n=1 Tax=Ambystoma mexicanum TaxID=8296 RepID=UPI0037E70D00